MTKSTVQTLLWHPYELKILDQRQLPQEQVYLPCRSVPAVFQAIRDMAIRGAPAIGIAGAYGVVLSLANHLAMSTRDALSSPNQATILTSVQKDIAYLSGSRPTAVNLVWALQRMSRLIEYQWTQSWAESGAENCELEDIVKLVEAEAVAIHQEDLQANFTMGQLGANFIAASAHSSQPCAHPSYSDQSYLDLSHPNQTHLKKALLTHCNTGSLATGGYGTALGVIRACFDSGVIEHVYADESRPWLQGSRLTAWELQQEGIPCTVIADSAAPYVMSQGRVGWVVVGADRIARNGDVANKIGTYALAIAAQYHSVKLMVVAPMSTFDLSLSSGRDIPIESRSAKELLCWPDGTEIAPEGVEADNPVFDVTPAELIDVIVTECGVIENPSTEAVQALFASNPLH